AESALSRHRPRRCLKLLQSQPAAKTPPEPYARAAAAKRRARRVWKSARDPSIHAPTSDSRDFRRPPATHIRLPPAAASAHPGTDLSWLRLQRLREPDATSAAARAVSRLAPCRARGLPASREILPSASLRATSN